MKDRRDIRNFINAIEQSFPVNNWKLAGVCIWPFLRMELYFYLVYFYETKAVAPSGFTQKIRARIKKVARVLWQVLTLLPFAVKYRPWLEQLKAKKILFVGYDAFRVTMNGERFNRFFDVMIDQHSLHDKAAFLEYSEAVKTKKHNDSLLIGYHKGIKYFKAFWFLGTKLGYIKDKQESALKGYDKFIDFLDKNEDTRGFARNTSKNYLLIPKFLHFFDDILGKIKPEKIITLCYYSLEPMALVTAANRKNITTYEMQHGPQTEDHLAYGSWAVIPESGYLALPRYYWCWDKNSTQTFSEWIVKNKVSSYRAFIGGNTWIDYWKDRPNEFGYKDYILYSLQPKVLAIDELFFPALIQCIRSQKYKWFIRMHPRQGDEKEEIIKFLKAEGVFDLVNIKEATTEPLPLVLANAKLHVTHFSGTAIEAAMLGKHSIILNEIGRSAFKKLIEVDEMAHFIDFKASGFEQKLEDCINKHVGKTKEYLQVKAVGQIDNFYSVKQ